MTGADRPDLLRAARKVVARHRGPGDLAALLDAVDELATALDAHDDAGTVCLCDRPLPLPFDVVQREAVTVAAELVAGMRESAWHYAIVALGRAVERRDGRADLAGAIQYDAPDALMPALPGIAESLRVLARELDDRFAASGCSRRADVSTTLLDAREP